MLGADQELPYKDTPELFPEQALLSKGDVIRSCIDLASAVPSLPRPFCPLPLTHSRVFSPSARETTYQQVSLFEAHKMMSSLGPVSFRATIVSSNRLSVQINHIWGFMMAHDGALLGNWLNYSENRGDLIHYK